LHLTEVYQIYPTERECIIFLEKMRWDGLPRCPYCKSHRSTFLTKEGRHHCNGCNVSYSVTVGTVFHRTHLPLQKWFLAASLIIGNEQDIPIRQLACDLQVAKNTASYIFARISRALYRSDQRQLLQDISCRTSDLIVLAIEQRTETTTWQTWQR